MRGAAVANYGGGAGVRLGCLQGGRAHVPQEEDWVVAWSALPRGCGLGQRFLGDSRRAQLQSLRSPELQGGSAPS